MDTARHRGPDPGHRGPTGFRPDRPDWPAGPAVGEAPSLDLWSLPVEPTPPSGTDSAKFVEAWMDVLALGSGNTHAAQPPVEVVRPVGSTPSLSPTEPSPPPTEPSLLPAEPSPLPAGPRPAGWKAASVAITLIALTGSALLVLLVVFSGRIEAAAHRTTGQVTTPPVDDRVVVPGPSADCLVWLVKPRPDASTNGVPGTCFVVG